MDHPYYTVTVASLTRGWSYTVTEGVSVDPDSDVVLTDPLTFSWSFKNELIPGQLEASTAGFNLAGTSASVLPEVQVGDLITIDVRIGTTGKRIIAPPPFRAAEPVVTLGKGRFPAQMTVPLTDLSADWRAASLGPPLGQPVSNPGGDARNARPYWRERGAEIAVVSGGVSLGCPTWWADGETTLSTLIDSGGRYLGALAYDAYGSSMYQGSLADVLEKFINSHLPGGYAHTWATVYNASGHPTGYGKIGPSTWVNGTNSGIPAGGPLSDPAGPLRVEAVPATRQLPYTAGLPLEFAVDGGILTLEPRDPTAISGYSTQVGLDAGWCLIPATARRARDSVSNVVNILGYGSQPNGEVDGGGVAQYDFSEVSRTYADDADVAARGALQRDLPTMLQLGLSDASTYFSSPEVAANILPNFLSDDTALNASWSYDAFVMLSSLVPQAIAAWLLPLLAPRLPDETDGDGRLVRNVTIYDLDGALRFDGSPVTGFVTAGSLMISGGEMTWEFRTAPGRPIYTGGTPTPVTVDDIHSASPGYADTHIDHIDPLITVADLDYVDS